MGISSLRISTICLILTLSSVLVAQYRYTTTRLFGTVTDMSGASIDGAKVTLTDKNGRKFLVATGDLGDYSIRVPAGTYQITVEHRGWSNFVIDKYVIPNAKESYLGMAMRVDPEFTKRYGLDVPADPESASRPKPDDQPGTVKLVELNELTKKIADQVLEPLWKSIKCNEPIAIFVINYGTGTENRRRASLITESWHFRCEFSEFRGFTFVDGQVGKPHTVIWEVPVGAKPPEP